MMNKSLGAAAALLGALLLPGCNKKQAAEPEPVVPVQVTEAVRGSIQRVISADGILFPVDQANVMPKISAPVSRFYVSRGDRVHKGQLLAKLENRDLAAAVTDAKGSYDQAAAQYRNTASATVPDELVKAQQDVTAGQEAMDAGQKLLQSRQKLFNEGALAKRLVDEAAVAYAQAKSTYETAKAHLASLKAVGRKEAVAGAAAQMESARGRFQGAQAQLAYSDVRSPIDGVVADRSVYAGEIAQAGSPLLTIMNISRVIARANVPASEAPHIRVGSPATVTVTGSDVQLSGKVTVVSPAVSPSSTTVEVWVETANPAGQLHPGVTVKVAIVAETIKDALLAPATALLTSQEGNSSVMVATPDSIAHEHKVEVGVRQNDTVQILSGIQAGDQLVTTGGVGLADGAKVSVSKPGDQSEEKPGKADTSGKKDSDNK